MAKILLIDDTPEVHEFVKRALAAEHEVFTTDNWTDSREYIFKRNIDLILMDVEMPGIFKGDKVTKILKKSVTNRPLKIVLFSSIDEDELRKKAEEVEADGYIHKTFNEKLFRLRLKRYVKNR